MSEKLWDIHQLIKNYPALKLWGVRWHIRRRTIPLVKISRRIFFDPEDISAWIEKQKIKPIQNDGGRSRG